LTFKKDEVAKACFPYFGEKNEFADNDRKPYLRLDIDLRYDNEEIQAWIMENLDITIGCCIRMYGIIYT